MIPYVVINGVSSRQIDGLLIQSLPPITKPKIRTTIEEIDGRDGDIVTTLGYAAYDKTLTIGLKGDYDVNDVMQFFNQSGKISFSNEIDKYYYFSTYDKIDFNRLIRFKTANVNLHMQPFKYAVDEPPISLNNVGEVYTTEIKVRNTGNIISRPKITITGSGNIIVKINDNEILSISLSPAGETIIIDCEKMNAIDPQGNYLNRKVKGDYSKVAFDAGLNTMYLLGFVNSVIVEKYSRWI